MTRLYSANETSTYEGGRSGSVGAYEIERPGGRLKLMQYFRSVRTASSAWPAM
jgi:hypothetical protein